MLPNADRPPIISASADTARPRLFATDSCESDPDFKRLIGDLSRRGLVFGGLGAISMTLVFVLLQVTFGGRSLGWVFDPDAGVSTVLLWDKLVLLVVGIVCIGFSRTRAALEWGRLVGAVLVLVVCAAILIDDFMHESVHSSSAYLVLVLLVAAGSFPFRPLQILGLTALAAAMLPALVYAFGAGTEMAGSVRTQIIYMIISSIMLTGITALIYRHRVEQYLWSRHLKHLNDELQTRSRALELAKLRTEEQAHRLEELEAAKSRFFSDISHEFRTPLTLILGPVQDALAERYGPLESRLRRHLEMMRRNALRLRHLINELLDLSRIEAGRKTLSLRHGDLHGFLREISKGFVQHAERSGVQFAYHSTVDKLPCVFDPSEMEKVITNLLSNAFKFTPEGGRIQLSLDVEGGIEIRVRDTGMGIAPAEMPRIFDRFQSAGSEKRSEGAGAGIGLALARELVQLHGGTIRAESEPGFGTTMIVNLPQLEATEVSEGVVVVSGDGGLDDIELIRSMTELPTPVEPGAPHVLIVDDNADVREYISDLLTSRYRVSVAGDGKEALVMATELRPDLVISDVMMPSLDGFELCRLLREQPETAGIPIVLLTARATEDAKIAGLEAGADDYLYKPFSASELLVRVENLIELRRRLVSGARQPSKFGPSIPDVPSADEVFVDRVRAVIEEHIGDSNFGVEWLADEVALSPRQLQRRIHVAMRLSAGGLIRMMRLQRAGQLFDRRAGTVSEVAYKVGFRDAVYFSRLFRQTFGVSPSEYMAAAGATGITPPAAGHGI
jgi:signal transduction histidine kinase/DNA-binding NarL/FixJ family response regulator